MVCDETALDSLARAAMLAGAVVETIVSSTLFSNGVTPALSQPGNRLEEYFPLGAAYQHSRLLNDLRAPFVAFVGGGLTVADSWVKVVLDVFRAHRTAAVVGVITSELAPPTHDLPLTALAKPLTYPADLWNCAFRRAAVEEAGGLDFRCFDSRGSTAYASLELLDRLTKQRWVVVRSQALVAVGTPQDSEVVRWWGLGRLARRRRDASLLVQAFKAAPQSRRRDVVAGALASRETPPSESVFGRMPESIRALTQGCSFTPLPASPYPKTHLMYSVGDSLVLHLYVNPSAGLHRSLEQREAIRRCASVAGVPRLHAQASATDSCWVLEDRVHGAAPRPRDSDCWFPRVAEWLVSFGGPPGPPLGSTDFWRAHFEGMLAFVPPSHESHLARALEASAALPSRSVHGDCQPRNLRLHGSSIGLIDWEGAWREGLPGLDLVFLALHARGDRAKIDVLRSLGSRQAVFPGLLPALLRLGITEETLATTVTTMLTAYALGEQRRLSRPGVTPGRTPYHDLLLAWLGGLPATSEPLRQGERHG